MPRTAVSPWLRGSVCYWLLACALCFAQVVSACAEHSSTETDLTHCGLFALAQAGLCFCFDPCLCPGGSRHFDLVPVSETGLGLGTLRDPSKCWPWSPGFLLACAVYTGTEASLSLLCSFPGGRRIQSDCLTVCFDWRLACARCFAQVVSACAEHSGMETDLTRCVLLKLLPRLACVSVLAPASVREKVGTLDLVPGPKAGLGLGTFVAQV